MERKFVRPTHPRARIPDVEHQDFLPAEGREVNWTVHWIRHERHGDIRAFGSAEAMAAFQPTDTDPSPDIPCAAEVAGEPTE